MGRRKPGAPTTAEVPSLSTASVALHSRMRSNVIQPLRVSRLFALLGGCLAVAEASGCSSEPPTLPPSDAVGGSGGTGQPAAGKNTGASAGQASGGTAAGSSGAAGGGGTTSSGGSGL